MSSPNSPQPQPPKFGGIEGLVLPMPQTHPDPRMRRSASKKTSNRQQTRTQGPALEVSKADDKIKSSWIHKTKKLLRLKSKENRPRVDEGVMPIKGCDHTYVPPSQRAKQLVDTQQRSPSPTANQIQTKNEQTPRSPLSPDLIRPHPKTEAHLSTKR